MKQIVRKISLSMLLLMFSVVMMAKVANANVVVASVQNGTISKSVDGQTCTLTVTPAAGNYIRKSDITVKPTVDPSLLTARAFESQDVTVPVAANLTLEGPDGPVQVATDYTFTVPDGYGAYVTATFTACTVPTLSVGIEGWIEGNAANEPTVSGNAGEAEVTYTYAVKGSSDFTSTVPAVVGEYTVKASVPAIGIYTAAEATADFAITAYTVTVPFAAEQAWGGFCSERNLSLPTGVKAYVIIDISDAEATAAEISYIPAGVPVLLYRDEATSAADYTVGVYSGSVAPPVTNLLKVDATDKEVTDAEIYVLYKNAFVLASAGTLPAGRVYLSVSGNYTSRLAIVIDGATAIASCPLSTATSHQDAWYSLDGRKLSGEPTRQGVYVYKGKKVKR